MILPRKIKSQYCYNPSFVAGYGEHTPIFKDFVPLGFLGRVILKSFYRATITVLIIILIFEQPCYSQRFRKIVLFPLENISGKWEVPNDIITSIAQDLQKRYGFEVVPPQDLSDFLLRNRIKRFGSITKAQAKGLKRAFGADAVVITWIDLYEKGKNPEIGIGIRFVETETSAVVWSDYVSLTGEDFTSWLGLGKITSIEQLQSKAIEDLMDHLPFSFRRIPVERTLYAIERFSLTPLISQGGAPVKTSLHLVSLIEPPKRLSLLIGGREWPLEEGHEGWWSGEIKAPKREGKYFARLKLLTKTGEILFYNTASCLKVDNTPPMVRLSYENIIFSPNRDGNKDALIVFPELLRPEDINLWGFYIYNKDGGLVKRFEGSGDLPLAIAWHGETDEFTKTGDGIYYLECRCQDKAGNIAVTPKKRIILDKTPPRLDVAIDTEKNKTQFTIKYKELTRISQWELKILDKKGKVYYDFKKRGIIPSQIEVPVLDKKERYFTIEVFDIAGNIAELNGSLMPQKMLTSKEMGGKEKAPNVWDYEF